MSQIDQKNLFDKETLDSRKLSELDAYIDALEEPQGDLIHVLHKGQELFGYLPPNLQLHIAHRLDLSGAKVNGVVSFYSFFTQKPRGTFTISVCMGTACFVRGAKDVLDAAREALGIENGQMSEDGLFSLRDIRCVGACGLAPVVTVNDKVHGHMDRGKMEALIASLREEANHEN